MRKIVTNSESKSPIAESIRALRTNLQFMNYTNGLQTILMTSTVSGEGKSWVAANLATAFAQTGKRTVLVDADMRKGTVHTTFGLELTPGLSNYLSGVYMQKTDIRSVVRGTPIENLYVITAGDIPPNPSELLLSDKMKDMLEDLKGFADVVIFDGTPSMLVTDAMILARLVGATVIVSEYNRTRIGDLKLVKQNLENVGAKIAGVVLNKIPTKAKRYGYGYGYGEDIENDEDYKREIEEEKYKKKS